jgi:hypothetical protein
VKGGLIVRSAAVVVAALALATACTAYTTDTPEVTIAPQAVEETSLPDTPTTQPTLTLSETVVPVPLPSLPDSVLEDFLFSRDFDPDCGLPCWQGLIVGEADRDDIQKTLDSVFGFDGRDVFSEPMPVLVEPPPPGLELAVATWSFPSSYRLSARFYVDTDTSLLEATAFNWGTSGEVLAPITLPQIIREMGTPSKMLVLAEGQPGDTTFFQINVIYSDGVFFYLSGGVPTNLTPYEGRFEGLFELCLDHMFGNRDAIITRPIPHALEQLSPLQEQLFFIPEGAVPFEQAFDVSLDELTDLALEQDGSCFQTDLSVFHR